MRIGITDPGNKDSVLYEQWIHRCDPRIEIQRLYWTQGASLDFSTLDGIVLTGGGDVHPKFYQAESEIAKAKRIDVARDEHELAVIRKALDKKIPLLGICRGMQIINVALGGSLIADLQSNGYRNHSKIDGRENRHPVRVLTNSVLYSIVGRIELDVNSYHHQAVKALAPGLLAVCWSADRVCEAAERHNSSNQSFLLLVQWHPERMEDFDNPASKDLMKRFYSEIENSGIEKNHQ
ncbi:MAG: gamma-glutamyl-gamma-aminobutyrate hydrolase family protein [bacterium]